MPIKDQFSEGCTRCSDYDKVKDDFKNLKEKSEDDNREALKQCEQSKDLLQKKLLKIGVVAVIAGTFLGKDFIDKIASYIESFNKVSDVLSLSPTTSEVTPAEPEIVVAQNTPPDDDKEEKDTKTPTKIANPYLGISLLYDPMMSYHNTLLDDSFINENTMMMNEFMGMGESLSMPFMNENDISDMLASVKLLFNDYNTFEYPDFTLPYNDGIMWDQPSVIAVVPGPGVLAPLAFAGVAGRRRRRNIS